ncbi:MAG: hypothetical protein U1F43_06120 [Myxococcota bacterium]
MRHAPALAAASLALLLAGAVAPVATAISPDPAVSNPALIDAFTSSDWARVSRAAATLEADPDRAVPLLMALVDRADDVELKDTADLIYPGAPAFYGHGYVLPYDLDSIAGRAGWVLEDIAMVPFGYEVHAVASRTPTEVEAWRVARVAAAKKARAWWAERLRAPRPFGRRALAVAALASSDPWRQAHALGWLRGCGDEAPPGDACPTLDEFDRDLRARVTALARSPDAGVKRQAELLLEERRAP